MSSLFLISVLNVPFIGSEPTEDKWRHAMRLKTASYSLGNVGLVCLPLCVGCCPRSTDLHNDVPLDRSTSRVVGP